jgi:cation diffusion facilitator CzcD-associated flavoprotein CzcO
MEIIETRVLCIGSGFSGLAVGIGLLRKGIRDFIIIEKASQIGGTWRDNTYPGCACDTPSHVYSFSFARNPSWSRVFAEQPEIQAYLLDVAERFSIIPHIHFETDAIKSTWDNGLQRWVVETNRGRYHAQFLVLGQGPLHEAQIPKIPGLDSFAGTTFHSSRWRHDYDLRGTRVAVIGTGASADSVRAEGAASGREAVRLPAQGGVGHAQAGPDHHASREVGLEARARAAGRSEHRALLVR